MASPDYRYILTTIKTAAPEDLILIVYDALIASSALAAEKLKNNPGDIQGIHDALRRGQRAIAMLMGALDFKVGGKLASSTFTMYEYWHRELVQANLRKDPDRVEALLPTFREFRGIWAEAIRRYRLEQREQRMERDESGSFVAIG